MKTDVTSHAIGGRVVSAIAVLALAIAIPASASAQSDPFAGTLKLNPAKSTFDPAPGPTSGTVVVTGNGQGLTATVDGIDPQGVALHAEYTIICDGQPHPITGDPFADALTCR